MPFELKSTEELVRIAVAGGGFSLNASLRSTTDLVRVANAASGKRARVEFSGMALRSTQDLVRIANAGGGAISFKD